MLCAEALQCLGRGMTVLVVAPDRQDGCRGRQFPEPFRPARRPAPVVPHLEQVHVPDPSAEYRLGPLTGIAHEDGAEGAIAHQQHHRIVVEVEPPPAPRRIGMHDREFHAVHGEPVPAPRGVPRRA